jgi:hypothetical protein
MATITNFGVAPPHDPMLGISSGNIVPRLTQRNWCTKEASRTIDGQCLYIMTQFGEVTGNGHTERRYIVTAHLESSSSRGFRSDFVELAYALAYANGEGKTAMTLATEPVTPEEYPDSRGADFVITGFTGQGRGRPPNFTIRCRARSKDICMRG